MRNQKVDEQIMHHLHTRGGGGPVIWVWRTVFTTAYFGFHQCLPGEGEEFNTGLTLMILWIVTFYCRKSQISQLHVIYTLIWDFFSRFL